MKMPTLRTFAALIAAGMGASAFAEVVDADGNWKRLLFNGKAQLVVRAAEEPGRLTVRARLVPTGAAAEIV